MFYYINFIYNNVSLFQFVLAAQEICSKLRLAGYWADFINPCSGRPYLTPIPANLYEADKSTTWEFLINDTGNCRVINKEKVQSHSFVGKLQKYINGSMEYNF